MLWQWVEIREDLSFSWVLGCDKKISLAIKWFVVNYFHLLDISITRINTMPNISICTEIYIYKYIIDA